MNTKDTILVRTTTDIFAAAAKVIAEPETSAVEVAQIARLAFFHRVQTDLWLKFGEKYDELTAIVICSFGSLCRPEVAVFFKDGDKIQKYSDSDYVTDRDLDALVADCIYEHQIKHFKSAEI